METRVLSPPATFNGLFLKGDIIQSIYDLLMASDLAYEIPSLEVYSPISLVELSVSLPQLGTLKCLNVLTLIATFGIGNISIYQITQRLLYSYP